MYCNGLGNDFPPYSIIKRAFFSPGRVVTGLIHFKWLPILLAAMLFFSQLSLSFAAVNEIKSVRVSAAPDSTRIIFDLSAEAKYKVFTLSSPERVVIDLENTKLNTRYSGLPLEGTSINQIRHAHKEQGVRIVLDMKKVVKPKAFLMKAQPEQGNRLVVDLVNPGALAKVVPVSEPPADEQPKAASPPPAVSKAAVVDSGHLPTRDFIVAIDPGHGGDDTGAIGLHHHLKEKDVVLSVSKRLQQLINAQPGMKAFLIRNGDYYVGLRKRMTIARQEGADLFISIHADSFKDTRATGASVFVLSEKGASNEAARWLAERENSSDLVGGISLEDKGDLLASVLIDLSQTASQTASHELAHNLITQLGKVTDLHHQTVQRAGFMVLKSPDIPSVLVELGFISNHRGEEKLLNAIHQQILAKALLSGIKSYVAKRPLPVKHPHHWTVAKNQRSHTNSKKAKK